MGHDVLRLNHVGDWGTQFGMLIRFMQVCACVHLICKPHPTPVSSECPVTRQETHPDIAAAAAADGGEGTLDAAAAGMRLGDLVEFYKVI